MMAHWRDLYGEAVHVVDYEQLVREPAAVARAIREHCGIEGGGTVPGPAFESHEIGRWRRYQRHLAPLRG